MPPTRRRTGRTPLPACGSLRFAGGATGSATGVQEPTPRSTDAPARQPDQKAPRTVSPTGVGYDGPKQGRDPREQAGDTLTTPNGVRIPDSDHSLKAGPRGPVLLEDFHLREKIMHFDHERIPERVVHARGAGAHGVFTANGAAAKVTRAAVLAEKGSRRRSSSGSPRCSARAARPTRCATPADSRRSSTRTRAPGTWSATTSRSSSSRTRIKFPDIIHAGKPHPDREIPQAQSAHDTFWDFVSLHTEATHHTIWNMSDRGIPRSYRTMEGFGVHTFRLVNAEPRDRPGQVPLEAAARRALPGLGGGADRRRASTPTSTAATCTTPSRPAPSPNGTSASRSSPTPRRRPSRASTCSTRRSSCRRSWRRCRSSARSSLNGNPTNFFAETEQVAFHTGHLVPGIEGTNDPLLQGRSSPTSTPSSPGSAARTSRRSRSTGRTRRSTTTPATASTSRPCTPGRRRTRPTARRRRPVPGGRAEGGYVRRAPARRGRRRSARRRRRSTTTSARRRCSARASASVEQQHVIDAYTFELGKCYEQAIKERALTVLAKVDEDLCAQVALRLGLPAPPPEAVDRVAESPALRQIKPTPFPIAGRDRRRGRRAGRRPRRHRRRCASRARGRGRRCCGSSPRTADS